DGDGEPRRVVHRAERRRDGRVRVVAGRAPHAAALRNGGGAAGRVAGAGVGVRAADLHRADAGADRAHAGDRAADAPAQLRADRRRELRRLPARQRRRDPGGGAVRALEAARGRAVPDRRVHQHDPDPGQGADPGLDLRPRHDLEGRDRRVHLLLPDAGQHGAGPDVGESAIARADAGAVGEPRRGVLEAPGPELAAVPVLGAEDRFHHVGAGRDRRRVDRRRPRPGRPHHRGDAQLPLAAALRDGVCGLGLGGALLRRRQLRGAAHRDLEARGVGLMAPPATIAEVARATPVVDATDVLVVGGGPAGVSAAVAAARSGARVTLVERYPYLGGLASGGMVLVLDDMVNGAEITTTGLVGELIERLEKLGLAVSPPPEDRRVGWDAWRRWARWGCNDFRARGKPQPIVYAVAFDPDGWKRVSDDIVVESGINPRLHSWFPAPLVADARLRGVVVEAKSGRQALLADVVVHATCDLEVPGFANCHVLDVASQLGVRQTRLLQGEYVVTKRDVVERRHFPDTVCRGRDYYTPYRALLPRGVEQLLVAGRHYSADSQAQKISREIPPCMVQGQAVGVAAALALSSGVRVRDVDPAAIRRAMRAQGADPGDVPSANAATRPAPQ